MWIIVICDECRVPKEVLERLSTLPKLRIRHKRPRKFHPASHACCLECDEGEECVCDCWCHEGKLRFIPSAQ